MNDQDILKHMDGIMMLEIGKLKPHEQKQIEKGGNVGINEDYVAAGGAPLIPGCSSVFALCGGKAEADTTRISKAGG